MTPDRKALGDVVVRHTCDGQRVCPDRLERRMVHIDRRGRYYLLLWTRRWPVARVKGTNRFICEFRGRTTA